jgi:K+-sensing histidine kinase KdpD
MGFLGFGLNWALFTSKVRSIRDYHTIENQRFDLAAKNRFLRRLNEARDRFFAIIAHDLRGPIGSQAEALTLLHEEHEQMSEKERRALIESLQKSSRRSYELLEELLRWARSQTGRIPHRPESFTQPSRTPESDNHKV